MVQELELKGVKASKAVNKVLIDMLQSYAFTFADGVDKTPDQSGVIPDAFTYVEMGFEGPVCGRIVLLLPEKMCKAITANALGFEETDPFVQTHFEDGAKELVNILGSHVLTEIAGDQVEFSLRAPQSKRGNNAMWSEVFSNTDSVLVVGDELPILCLLEGN